MARSRVVNLANFEQFTAINLLADPGHIGGPTIAPNVAEIRLNFALEDTKSAHCVLHGRYSSAFAGSLAQCNAIFAALSTGGSWTALAAFLATTTQFTGVSIRDINSAGNPYLSSNTAAVPGTSASPSLPNEVALVASLGTAKTGPGNRGRFYLPGWATNALGAGNVAAAAAVTAFNTWQTLILPAFSAQGYTWVIAQPARAAYVGSTGTSHPARPAGSAPVTTTITRDNHWDSQRRRGLK